MMVIYPLLIRVAVLDKVTDFLLFLGKILVAGGVGKLSSIFIRQYVLFSGAHRCAHQVHTCLVDSWRVSLV